MLVGMANKQRRKFKAITAFKLNAQIYTNPVTRDIDLQNGIESTL